MRRLRARSTAPLMIMLLASVPPDVNTISCASHPIAVATLRVWGLGFERIY